MCESQLPTSESISSTQESEPNKRMKMSVTASPPSVTLSIPSTSKSHASCLICKKPGPKLIVVTQYARVRAFLRKKMFVPAGSRCCPKHIADKEFTDDALQQMQQTNPDTNINRTSIVELLQQTREFALRNESIRLNFDDAKSMDNEDYYNLTGLTKDQFDELLSYLKDVDIRATKTRSVRTCIAILLTKLRCGMSNHLLGTLFGMQKWQIRRAVLTAKHALMLNFVPHHLGFSHITREDVKENHTRPLAKELLCTVTENPVILVLDGTYIYLQKSGNFTFSRRSFSTHKHRPLIKPMIVVTTSGYVVSVLGPYLADSKNSDAKILTHMIETNVEEIKDWIKEEDIFIVDRGFRDAETLLNDIGIHVEMPSFLPRGTKQHTTEEANATRLVTKLRWVVESVNGRIKTWNYLDRTIPNSQIPHIGDYVRIISAICNKFRPDVSTGLESDLSTAAKMRFLSKEVNVLKEYVETNGLDKRQVRWRKIDASDTSIAFPQLSEEEIRELTMGVYQIKLAKSYAQEHLDKDGTYEIYVNNDHDGILRAKLQSRHTSAKTYLLWIGFDEINIKSWFCKCKIGSRVVGMCSHITSVIWFLSFARHRENPKIGVRSWCSYVDDAAALPVDDSDSDEDSLVGNEEE
ncbi:uncharacterized protein LOC134280537 [Saccostrea cucullata]|uniref:uncharacterized protein LOC134280537 n=1 Tax=Saccostrea cuccullata TaxID=36930 RepID=UPI002ED2A9AA